MEIVHRQHPVQHPFDLAVLRRPPAGDLDLDPVSGPALSIAAPVEGGDV